MINIEAVNRLEMPEPFDSENKINICWMMAANNGNTDTLKYRNHTHNFYEAHFVLSGHITYGFDTKAVTVKNGEYVIVSPMTPHRVAEHSDDFTKLTVAFEAHGSLHRAFTEFELNASSMTAEMKRELDFVFLCAANVKLYTSEVVLAGLTKLILLIAEASSKRHPPKSQRISDGRVLKAKRLIEDNPNIFFTASELANYCGISLKHLGRLFLKYEGIGVLEYIHQEKLAVAKAMITESEATLEAVSQALGFSDVSYFSKFFLRNEGVTPSEYRKNTHNCKFRT